MAEQSSKPRESKKEFLQRKRRENVAKKKTREYEMDWTKQPRVPAHAGKEGGGLQPAGPAHLMDKLCLCPGMVSVPGCGRLPRCDVREGVASGAEELDALEKEAFEEWEAGLVRLSESLGMELSWHERRLDFWRQLWRVLERSHVVLVLADARCPLYHLHPGLLLAVQTAGLPMLVVLNKEDLTSPPAAAAWREYLSKLCGEGVSVVSAQARIAPKARGGQAGSNWEAARTIYEALLEVELPRGEGPGGSPNEKIKDLLGCTSEEIMSRIYGEGCEDKQRAAVGSVPEELSGRMINIGMHDLDDNADHWDLKGTKARKKEAQRKKRHQHGKGRRETPAAEEAEEPHDYGEGGDDGSSDADDDSSHEGAEEDKPPLVEEPVADGAIVVGVLGEPNVGKSSIINALLGAHKVAVSSHPGRTRHYQTHFVPGTSNLVLCDSPGLVFPRLGVGLPLQTLYGSYPIARCREPYSVVRYLADRIEPPLHQALHLQRCHCSDYDEDEHQGDGQNHQKGVDGRDLWSPLGLCEALAHRNKWKNKRGGRLDIFRAANWILRAALRGQQGIGIAFWPPEELPDKTQVMAGSAMDRGLDPS